MSAPAPQRAPGREAPSRSSTSPTRWYWLAAALAAVGLLVSIAWGAVLILRAIDAPRQFARGDVPGAVSVTVPRGAVSVVYYEGNARLSPHELGLTVTGPGNEVVAAPAYRDDLRYDAPRRGVVGTAIASFRADRAGTFRITTTEGAERGATLAVGGDVSRAVAGRLLGPAVLALGALAAAGAIAFAAARRDQC